MKNPMIRKIVLEEILVLVGFMILIAVIIRSGVIPGYAEHTTSQTNAHIPPLNPCEEIYGTRMTQAANGKAQSIIEDYQGCMKALRSISTLQVPNPHVKILTVNPTTTIIISNDLYKRLAGGGILTYGVYNSPPSLKIATSVWDKNTLTRQIRVYAGYTYTNDKATPSGAVVIMTFDQKNHILPDGGTYVLPNQSGRLTIIDAKGDILYLIGEDGTLYTFDLNTRQFGDPPEKKVHQLYKHAAKEGVILESDVSPFPKELYTIKNSWSNDQDGRRISVYVGVEKGANNKNILLITQSAGELTGQDSVETFQIPSDNEAQFRIVEAIDQRIILVNQWGNPQIFNLKSRRFISSTEIKQSTPDPALSTYEEIYQITPDPTTTLIPTPDWLKTVPPAYP